MGPLHLDCVLGAATLMGNRSASMLKAMADLVTGRPRSGSRLSIHFSEGSLPPGYAGAPEAG